MWISKDNLCQVMQFLLFRSFVLTARLVCKDWSKLPIRSCFKPCRLSCVPASVLHGLISNGQLYKKIRFRSLKATSIESNYAPRDVLQQFNSQRLNELADGGVWDFVDVYKTEDPHLYAALSGDIVFEGINEVIWSNPLCGIEDTMHQSFPGSTIWRERGDSGTTFTILQENEAEHVKEFYWEDTHRWYHCVDGEIPTHLRIVHLPERAAFWCLPQTQSSLLFFKANRQVYTRKTTEEEFKIYTTEEYHRATYAVYRLRPKHLRSIMIFLGLKDGAKVRRVCYDWSKPYITNVRLPANTPSALIPAPPKSKPKTRIDWISKDNQCLIMQFLNFHALMLQARQVCKLWSKLPLKMCFKPCRLSCVPLRLIPTIAAYELLPQVELVYERNNIVFHAARHEVEQLNTKHLISLTKFDLGDLTYPATITYFPGRFTGITEVVWTACYENLISCFWDNVFCSAKRFVFPLNSEEDSANMLKYIAWVPRTTETIYIQCAEDYRVCNIISLDPSGKRVRNTVTLSMLDPNDKFLHNNLLRLEIEIKSKPTIVYQRNNTSEPFVLLDASLQNSSTNRHPSPTQHTDSAVPAVTL